MKKETKLFAFKLAKKSVPKKSDMAWKAREGVALAGCTISGGTWPDLILQNSEFGGQDNGSYC